MRPAGVATLLLAALALACARPAAGPRAEQAEAPETRDPSVPAAVQDEASRIVRRLGRAGSCTGWSFDADGAVWRCSLAGGARSAELELDPAGRFVDLDLELGFAEIEQAAPAAAAAIADGCGEGRGVAELSIRAEPLVGSDPRLARLWGEDHVFIEVTCPDGTRFELDAFGTVVPE